MRLASARDLKADLLTRLVDPFAARVSRLRRTGAIAVAAAAAFAGLEPDDTVFGIGARPFDTLPEIQRSIALGVARRGREYRLAVRVQRPSLARSPLMDRITRGAKGEVDVRIVGRIDKRAKPWHQRNTRPDRKSVV